MPHPTEGHLPITVRLAAQLKPRLMQTVVKEKRRNGCWIRTYGGNRGEGYSNIGHSFLGKTVYYQAHRIMYVTRHGEIPERYTIDHLCERPACCNPSHLRAVPMRDNVMRSKRNPFAVNARKTHCIHGHEFTPENTRVTKRGRVCKACVSARYVSAKAERPAGDR